jgi:pimeloyl-ACP methyl ester carboxylesterase
VQTCSTLSDKTFNNDITSTYPLQKEYLAMNLDIDYEHSIRDKNASLNPVIVIPGILGSKLVDIDLSHSLWGDFGKSFAHPKSAKNLRKIALPMQLNKKLHQLQSTSKSDGSMRYVKGAIVGLPVQINIYAGLMDAMGVGIDGMGGFVKKLDDYVDDRRYQANAFEFSYDWRRSLDENAIELGKFIQQVTRFIRMHRGNHNPVKFDIVAHSMGGLIARYFLQYGEQLLPDDDTLPIANWAGSSQIERVVIIGTPNAGSLFALESLVVGFPGNPVTPGYDPIVLGTMPAIYQLLPRLRHKTFKRSDATENNSNFLDINFWIAMSWGLADPSKGDILIKLLPGIETPQKRRETALDHLDKCLKATIKAQQALDNGSQHPEHLKMFLFVGDNVPTPLLATAKKGDKKLTILKQGAGDGTVPRASVLMDERVGSHWSSKVKSHLKWDNVIFLSKDHMGLTKDPLCIKNILYTLLERP